MSYMSLLESKCASSHLCFSAFENQVEAGHLSRSEKFSREDLNYRVRALGVGSGLNMEIFNVLSARSKTPPNLLFFPWENTGHWHLSGLFLWLTFRSEVTCSLLFLIKSSLKCRCVSFHCLAAVCGLRAIFLTASYGTCTNFSHIGFQYFLPLLPF